jgi:cellobiose-specific phosphotransferase system component IIA
MAEEVAVAMVEEAGTARADMVKAVDMARAEAMEVKAVTEVEVAMVDATKPSYHLF